ncbi:MAG: SPFH domain-containing protein [Isosphaeraceae bacterium]
MARVGLPGPSAAAPGNHPVAWNAAHGGRRDESALFFTGDENLVELAAVVEYRLTREGLANALFGTTNVDKIVALAAEAALRESAGRTALEAILVERRGPFEQAVGAATRDRLAGSGLGLKVDRVRVLDAHPPREVVPSYRDVSAAQADAERYRNEAEAFAAERVSAAKAEAAERLDAAEARANRLARKAEGEHDAFLDRRQARSGRADLTDFRLLSDAWAASLAGREKLILDPRASGRRQIWLADPERFNLPMPASIANPPPPDD